MIDQPLTPIETHSLYPELSSLTIDSCIGHLPVHDCAIDDKAMGQEVAALLNDKPDSPGVIVHSRDHSIGLISRRKYLENIGQRFRYELYMGRSVDVMLKKIQSEVLRLPSACPIFDGARLALARQQDLIYEPIIVEFPHSCYRLLDAHVLMLAQSQLLELSNHIIVRQKENAEILRAAGYAFSSSLNVQDVIEHVLHFIDSLVVCDHASIHLTENNSMRIYSQKGIHVSETAIHQAHAILPRLTGNNGDVHVITDMLTEEQYSECIRETGLRSWMIIPFNAAQGVDGSLCLADRSPAIYEQKDASSLSVLINQASSAIQNARQYQTERKRVREMEALQTATSSLVSTLDLQVLLDRILHAAMSAIPTTKRGAIHILDADEDTFQLRSLFGFHQSSSDDPAYQACFQRTLQVIRRKDPVIMTFVSDGEHKEQEPSPWSSIVIPLINDENIIGALSLETPGAKAFSDGDVQILSIFGVTATAAIQNAQLHAEVEQMAITDSLTGLLNRRGFYRIAEKEVERAARYNRPLAVIMADIDLFKRINDTYGHDSGDHVIQKIGALCKKPLRTSDIASRYGGEEFMILLPECDLFGAQHVAERFRRDVEACEVPVPNASIHASVSLGIAMHSPDVSLEELLNRADQAMYASKVGGRNRCTTWSDLISISAALYEAGTEEISERFAGAFEQVAATLQQRETQYRILETAHHISQVKLAAILQNASEAILSVDSRNKIIVFNRGAERIFGYGADEILGNPLKTLMLPGQSDHWDQFLASAESEPSGTSQILGAVCKNGAEITVEASVSRLYENGETIHTVILNDITERKLAEERIKQSHLELKYAYDETIEGWARALELRDYETCGHSKRVVEMTLRIALAMNVDQEEIIHIRRGALLHDVGKMGIPDRILLKPGPLDEEEWEMMRKHPVFGYEMLFPITFLRPALTIVRSHHERWDGSGYPDGKSGLDIPLAARIFSVADVWDALCSKRPYSDAWEEKVARDYIRAQSGVQFDPKVVDVFFQILDRKEFFLLDVFKEVSGQDTAAADLPLIH